MSAHQWGEFDDDDDIEEFDDEACSPQGSGSSFSASSFIFCSCMRLRTEPRTPQSLAC